MARIFTMKLAPSALRRLSLVVLLILPGMVTLSGCTKGPKMARVRGKCVYKGGSVPQGGVAVVRFSPAGDSTTEVRKGATSAIDPDGSFELWTRKPGDGVYL